MSPLDSTSTAITPRQNPYCPCLPYALDASVTGLHICPPTIRFTHDTFLTLLFRLEVLSTTLAVKREHDLYRIAWRNHQCVGSVYDIPTTPGWAVLQKHALVNVHIAALVNTTQATYALPKALLHFDDIRPDEKALPEVTPYTQLAAVLYEALDNLLLFCDPARDSHLRNLYPHSIWSAGVIFSQGQVRRLAPHAPPPRTFSRWLECPIVGEIFAVPGEVCRHGWITLYNALVPTFLSGGVQSETGVYHRFVPRSRKEMSPAPASLILENLTFAELYYLLLIEKFSGGDDIQAIYHSNHVSHDTSVGLVDEYADKMPFCEFMGVKMLSAKSGTPYEFDGLEKEAKDRNAALAYAEQAMCNAMSQEEENEEKVEDVDVSFVYKRDARVDFATLDGYDGWCDEELIQKKHKAWAVYKPSVLMPAEVAALYSRRGVRLYSCAGKLTILCESHTARDPDFDNSDDTTLPDGVHWTELRSIMESLGPPLEHIADRLLLSLVVAGHIRLFGYFYCADSSQERHHTRGTGVFMDAPLWVLGFKLCEKQITFREDDRVCIIVPIGPACTILLRQVTEKFSTTHGRVHHSEKVTVLPYGCRLGNRRHLKWYAVGAGPWEGCDQPPKTLIELSEKELGTLSCSASAGRDHIVITAKKGLASVKLRNVGFKAGWSSWSPHLIITGTGKRVTTSVRTHSLTHLVEVLRGIRDVNKKVLSLTIQEIASMLVLKEALIGGLLLTRRETGLEWSPPWKLADEGFVVPHAMSLPRGTGAKEVDTSEGTVGVLVSQDTMAVFEVADQESGFSKWQFMRIDAGIESEKLLVAPTYEGFVSRITNGTMGA